MNVNGNNNDQETQAHQIPADASASDNDEVGNETNANHHENNERENDGTDHDANNRDGTQQQSKLNANRGGGDQYSNSNGGGENQGGNHHQSGYTNNRPQMLDNHNQNMYPNNNNGPHHFFPPLEPQHAHFDPSFTSPTNHNMPPFQYNPIHHNQPSPMNHGLPPTMPPMLPAPPSLPMPMNVNNGPNNLDATRQYYEMQMRQHAMQYANAAAGAAWAAARIACGEPPGGPVGMPGFMPNHSAQSYYTPASPPSMGGAVMAQDQAVMSPQQMMPASGPRQKRMLWHPPSSTENSKEKAGGPTSKVPKKGAHGNPDNSSAGSNAKGQSPSMPAAAARASRKQSSEPQNEKKRSKKRESGNDSVSSLGSLGSESLDLSLTGRGRKSHGSSHGPGSGSKHNSSKKSSQRRRINEDAHAAAARLTNSSGKNDNNGNLRQKRGLHHGHSSKGSFSSLGSNNNPLNSSGRNRSKKKKNLGQPESPLSASHPTSIHLGGLIGKNGARALHELCSKYRWEMPRYTSIENQGLTISTGSDGATGNNDIAFVLTVHVNGVELGRGRGGTKVAAKQDASRKALAALVPGVVFDPNGILLDVGSSKELLMCGSNEEGAVVADRNNIGGTKSLSLDELGPHLASQLAIGGNARPPSPAHSETSSISTKDAVSVTKTAGEVISGGPFSQKLGFQLHPSPGSSLNTPSGANGRFFSPNIYPCASTTSGVSSASEVDDEDENVYYSSRGASVCSTLLHAMWQIDDRIREPPSYVFDICPSPLKMKNDDQPAAAAASSAGAACSKRKKVESPRDIATSTAQRMFQCIASINLYFPKDLVGDVNNKDSLFLMDYWESPLDYLQPKEHSPTGACDKGESSSSRKRKDSFASQSTPSPHRPQRKLSDGGAEEQQDESPDKTAATKKQQEKEEYLQHKLESIGTGSTKRESKHKASAKLLAALFPGCTNGIVEVKAEAEAAREMYAAKKASSQTKRVKLTTASASASPERDGQSKSKRGATKSDISLHALSLSEPKEAFSKRIKWSDSATSAAELALECHNTSIENEVDAALQALQELDEEPRDFSLDDVGKIILRRASPDDVDNIHALLNKINEPETSNTALASKKRFSALQDDPVDDAAADHGPAAAPESHNVEENNDVTSEEKESATKPYDKSLQLLGENSILLVLSRAVALHEPLLGCAILTLKCSSSNEGGRNIVLRTLSCEEHLPRERFVECLEAFTKNIQCNLVDTCSSNCCAGLAPVTSDDIRSFISRSRQLGSPYHVEDEVDIDRINGNYHLQSVKEEDSEEVDDGSCEGTGDDNGAKNETDAAREEGSLLAKKGRPSKPSKRTRVA